MDALGPLAFDETTAPPQAADARARGFLLGATAGRTTLNGEGLQHQAESAVEDFGDVNDQREIIQPLLRSLFLHFF